MKRLLYSRSALGIAGFSATLLQTSIKFVVMCLTLLRPNTQYWRILVRTRCYVLLRDYYYSQRRSGSVSLGGKTKLNFVVVRDGV